MPSLSQKGGVMSFTPLQYRGQRRLWRVMSAEQETHTGGRLAEYRKPSAQW